MAAPQEEEFPQGVIVSDWKQLAEMRDPGDNWTGVTGTAERKKRQNRLNQRAVRRRRKLQQNDPTGTSQTQPCRIKFTAPGMEIHMIGEGQLQTTEYGDSSTTENDWCIEQAGHLLMTCPQRLAQVRRQMRAAYEDYALNAPRPEFLQVLIRINVLNAMARNAIMLGLPVEGLCHDDFISPFSYCGPRPPDSIDPLAMLPESLRPTATQMTVIHHPWIDTFPIPRLRDNVLRGILAEDLDEDDLCKDLLRVEDEKTADEKPALIIWGDPWDVRGWEASVAFLKKWGWLMTGCPELLASTNYWRTQRGEKRLNFGLS
ncbi:hypothetical protein G7Z17_g7266 [Cylindrodendrum hubeiense]|uniref:BZIP domain-containing protein n=1 Tax=Cylindrodendrum hubeiense TaxID=595255 RepID=A0A9P5H7E8_9HYPO|nr:hypothetical protein G7Z17_g7266 [Cylindrodendrum hubeiense]